MNQFSFETKMRKLVYDLVQPNIIEANQTMVNTQKETQALVSRVNLLEKRLNKLKKDTIIVSYIFDFEFPLTPVFRKK